MGTTKAWTCVAFTAFQNIPNDKGQALCDIIADLLKKNLELEARLEASGRAKAHEEALHIMKASG